MNRLVIIGLLVVGVLAVGVYRAKLGASETEARNAKLKAEIAETTKGNNALRAEATALQQPSRIGPIARNRLGLEPSTPDQFTAPEQIAKRIGEAREVQASPTPALGQMTAPPVPPLKAQAPINALPKPKPAASPVAPQPSPAPQ